MQGVIQSVAKNSKGNIVGKIETDNGVRNIYGLSTVNVAAGTEVEYEMHTSSNGFRYAKFLRYVTAADHHAPGNDNEGDEDDNEAVNTGEIATGRNVGAADTTAVPAAIADGYMTVSQLNELVRGRIEVPRLQDIWVKGEVTNSSNPRPHYYFSIKDENAIIFCILWEGVARQELNFRIENGQQVAIKGSMHFSEQKGSCSIWVSKILNLGEGDAWLRYQQLKDRLQNEGLFDAEHHKEIPRHAERVGIITSKDGKAIGDICKVARERNPYVQLILYDVKVQGVHAVDTAIEAINRLDQENLDVIIIGRGGGSDEDLLVYNDERLVRAVYNARTPIVSAVGHQDHMPLVDGVVDARFATPTDAAVHVISDVMSEINRVDELSRHIAEKTRTKFENRSMKLAKLKAELEKNSPESRLEKRKNRLELARTNMRRKMDHIFSNISQRYIRDAGTLDGLSPTAKLVRGFGYISAGGKPVTSIDNLKADDEFSVKIHDGDIKAKVVSLYKTDKK